VKSISPNLNIESGIYIQQRRPNFVKEIATMSHKSNFFLSTLKYMFNAQITKSAKLDFCSAKKEERVQAKKSRC